MVFTFFVETTLSINGALKCPAKTEFASTGISAPISGEVRMDTLYPATNNASVREISWDTLERGGRIYKNYCEQSAVEMIDTSL